jgi:hypothetical protein
MAQRASQAGDGGETGSTNQFFHLTLLVIELSKTTIAAPVGGTAYLPAPSEISSSVLNM